MATSRARRGQSRLRRPGTARRSAGRSVLRWLAWLLGCALGPLALAGWLWWPQPLPQTPFLFELTPGRTLHGVAQDLANQRLLVLPDLFSLLGRLHPRSSQLRAGSYQLDGPVAPWDLYALLFRGRAQQHDVTLIEGHTLAQVRAALARDDRLDHDVQALDDAALVALLQPVAALPVAPLRAEGLLFPDSYFFPGRTSESQVLRRAAQALQKRLQQAWDGRAEGLPLRSPYEALVLASLIERETARGDERPQIAGVFVHRLQLGMRLQTDPSVIYGMGTAYQGRLHHADLLRDTPWNTYTRAGLPPTPIGLVGMAALQAALHPVATDALYFVARGDGTHQFSATLAEHEQAVDRYLRHTDQGRKP